MGYRTRALSFANNESVWLNGINHIFNRINFSFHGLDHLRSQMQRRGVEEGRAVAEITGRKEETSAGSMILSASCRSMLF